MAMQNATVERLVKIISEPERGDGSNGNKRFRPRKPTIQIHLGMAEGWFSLFLLATVVYSTIWCVQAAEWVANLNILSLTTALGLIAGVIAAKQRRLSRAVTHLIAIVFGILLAFWQTAGADHAGSTTAFAAALQHWISIALVGGSSNDDSIFLFFITALGFILAYTSAWLVYRTRSPWLVILANAVVLLINLSNIPDGYIVFLVVFLIASLLLLLRFNLYESAVRWKRLGLRCADDLGWDFMQAGALISIGILIFSWLLPSGYTDSNASQIWSADNNPWVQLQNTWNRLVSVSGGVTPANHGNFTDSLTLGGNPNLTDAVVFTVKTDEGTQYLQSLSYSTYDGRTWSLPPTSSFAYKAGSPTTSETQYAHLDQQQITVVSPPGEQKSYIFGASQIGWVDQDGSILSSIDGSVIAWLRRNGKFAAGDRYNVISYVSSADVKTLETVPFPKDAPVIPPSADVPIPPTVYDSGIVKTYTQLPPSLDPNILKLTEQITANAPTMYDKAVALESYFHNNYDYSVNISLPSGEEGVSWFLFRSGHKGYCNYFATSMTVMARLLGMPARMVVGYTNGTKDPNHPNQWIVRGKDAHAWTQIYFAGYGWVNFEPSASFTPFSRPLPGSLTTTSNGPGNLPTPVTGNRLGTKGQDPLGSNATSPSTTSAQSQALLRMQLSVALGGIILLILVALMLFSIWWRRLFRGYGIASQIYGRICILANWAGISIQPSQTPYEYLHTLSEATPDQAITLERLGDIYVRERWADPASPEHPQRTGETQELPGLWRILQPRLFLYLLQHPHFLR